MIMEDIAVETFDSHGRHRLQLRTGMSNYSLLLFVSRLSSDKEDEPTELAKAQSGAHTEDNAFFFSVSMSSIDRVDDWIGGRRFFQRILVQFGPVLIIVDRRALLVSYFSMRWSSTLGISVKSSSARVNVTGTNTSDGPWTPPPWFPSCLRDWLNR